MSLLQQFDHYLNDNGPAALVLRQQLMPVEGTDGVVFPATFASGDGFPGGYNIDGDPNGNNVCLIDSVGSQANRIEPLFTRDPYAALVPQINVRAGEKIISIMEAAHRAGDALVRCSELKDSLREAFKTVLKGNVEPLALLAPTSLLFGVWDSRDTQAKLPRLVASTIRAFNVRKITRSAQFNPATEYVNEGLLDEPADKPTKDSYAERGFIHVPATGTHGGVIADGGIRRDATLALAALRCLQTPDAARTQALQRYILGLAMVAYTAHTSSYLRQGCMLVVDPHKSSEFVEVFPNGERKPCSVTHEQALAYSQVSAAAFGVGESKTVEFDKERAKQDVKGDTREEDPSAPKRSAKKAARRQ